MQRKQIIGRIPAADIQITDIEKAAHTLGFELQSCTRIRYTGHNTGVSPRAMPESEKQDHWQYVLEYYDSGKIHAS